MRVIKIQMRLARLSNGLTLDRDVIGAINIGLKYLSTDGRGVAFTSTGTHAAWAKLVIPSLGPTPLTELKIFTHKYLEVSLAGKRLKYTT